MFSRTLLLKISLTFSEPRPKNLAITTLVRLACLIEFGSIVFLAICLTLSRLKEMRVVNKWPEAFRAIFRNGNKPLGDLQMPTIIRPPIKTVVIRFVCPVVLLPARRLHTLGSRYYLGHCLSGRREVASAPSEVPARRRSVGHCLQLSLYPARTAHVVSHAREHFPLPHKQNLCCRVSMVLVCCSLLAPFKSVVCRY